VKFVLFQQYEVNGQGNADDLGSLHKRVLAAIATAIIDTCLHVLMESDANPGNTTTYSPERGLYLAQVTSRSEYKDKLLYGAHSQTSPWCLADKMRESRLGWYAHTLRAEDKIIGRQPADNLQKLRSGVEAETAKRSHSSRGEVGSRKSQEHALIRHADRHIKSPRSEPFQEIRPICNERETRGKCCLTTSEI
jgi:hypothetical protein